VAVKIKLKRLGKIRAPYYRIVIADSRTKRDGRAIEEIGKYHPKAEPSFIEVDSERAQHWLSVGAQPTDPVRKIFEITGDWQKFKGLPGTEGTLRTAEPKADRKIAFAAAVAETLSDSGAKAKPKGKAADAKAGIAKAADAKGGGGKAEKAPARARKAAEKSEESTAVARAGAAPAEAAAAEAAPAGATEAVAAAEPAEVITAAEPAEVITAAEPAEVITVAEPAEVITVAEPAEPAEPAEVIAAAEPDAVTDSADEQDGSGA
jgi:small subunit ribosomal protein S16